MELLKASGAVLKEQEAEKAKETGESPSAKQPKANFRTALKAFFEFRQAISLLPPATQVLLRILHKPMNMRSAGDREQLTALIKDHKFV